MIPAKILAHGLWYNNVGRTLGAAKDIWDSPEALVSEQINVAGSIEILAISYCVIVSKTTSAQTQKLNSTRPGGPCQRRCDTRRAVP